MLSVIFIVVLFSMIIGYFGRHRKLGYWGYFFGSILFTPVIGFLLLIASDPKK